MNEHPYLCVQKVSGTDGPFLVYHLVLNEAKDSLCLEKAIPEKRFRSFPEAEDFFFRYMVKHASHFDGDPPKNEEEIPSKLYACGVRIQLNSRLGRGNIVITHGATAPMYLVRQKLLGGEVYQSDIIPPHHALVLYKGNNKYDGAAVLAADGKDVWLSMHPNANILGVLINLKIENHPV